MAAKRHFSESGSDPDEPNVKRMRTRPSFASVIGEVIMGNYLQNLCSALEPVLRRVVQEEVEDGIRHRLPFFTRSPSLRIQLAPEPSTLQLTFRNKLSLPIFTGTKISDAGNNSLQILLVDTRTGPTVPVSLPNPIKIDIVVLDGDFPLGDSDSWSSEEFESNIVRERTGKRPLLTGELMVTVRDGVASSGDLEFTDNSSWIRSRKFRIGAKVAQGSFPGVRVREAMTEAFVVKDHRGNKHHPPMLEDEVWRLEKIGKDGAFHKKLSSSGIKTVQDFLKLSVVDPARLRRILGNGMSEKMWEVTIKHARKCVMGNKLYIFRGPNYTIILNPICQLIRAVINGHMYPFRDKTNISRLYVENLVRQAYANWNSLEEVEGVLNETALLTQGEQMVDQYANNQQLMVRSFQQNGYPTEKSMADGYITSNVDAGRSDWQMISSTYFNSLIENSMQCSIMESSSDDDLSSRTFINGSS